MPARQPVTDLPELLLLVVILEELLLLAALLLIFHHHLMAIVIVGKVLSRDASKKNSRGMLQTKLWEKILKFVTSMKLRVVPCVIKPGRLTMLMSWT